MISQETEIYKILMDLVHACAYDLKSISHNEPVPLKELSEVTKLYCMLKDGLRDDVKMELYEKI